MKRIRGYKYRAYPNSIQQEFFSRTFGSCRFVFNHYLEKKQRLWKECHESLSYTETSKDLSHHLKKENPWLRETDSIALQQTLRHLDRAYDNFFKKRGGYPKFKSKRYSQSYRTMNVNDCIRINGDRIRIPKAGEVKIRNTRDFEGRILSATVSVSTGGRYYITLQVEEEWEVLPNNGGETGLDAGLSVLYTDSSGNAVQNPKTLRKHEKKIARLQRRLSKKKKGSKNREKARKRLARELEKVTDFRKDYLHKVSYRLASENQVVCAEDLNVKGMMKNKRLAKSIGDVSWGEFYRMLEYKMADHGGKLVKVPRTFASSQQCSSCGKKEPKVKDLSVRRWKCSACGAIHDRDVNAAINILRKGKEILAS